MIESINPVDQNVLPNANVLFSEDVVRTRSANCCGWLTRSNGSGLFQLTKAGIYKIEFKANITSDVAGPVNFAIKSNGEVLGGSQINFIATANGTTNVNTFRYIRVCPNGSTTISIGNVGTGAVTVNTPNIAIIKEK